MGRISPCLMFSFVLVAIPAIAGETPEDLKILKARLHASCLEGAPEAPAGIQELVRSLQPDGHFEDVDYKDRMRSGWKTIEHLNRTLCLARACRRSGQSQQGDAALLQATRSALDFWLENKFKNPNWWWNRIGVPRTLYKILLLMESELTPGQMEAGIELLKEGRLGMTGQNLVWVADITIARGCLENDPALVAKAFDAVAGTISTAFPEGIKDDCSFHQHGKCLYSGGYGLGFSIDCSRLAVLARGTRFAFSKEKIGLLGRYILDGQQWMMRGGTFDYGAVGREISRKGKTGKGMAAACMNMAQLDTARRPEFEAFARRIQGKAQPSDLRFSGNRQFWCSDIMTHTRPGYYTSVRMCSTRIDNTDDPCNNEGLLSHHIADGATFIFKTGREYYDIFGVWDWLKIPGATIEQKPLAGPPRHRGTKSFVGGVSDGHFGLAASDFALDDLAAKKSWFYFDDEFVCLGAGITCSSDNPVYTSINQCRLEGDVLVSAGGRNEVAARGRHALKQVQWIHHNGVGYLFMDPQEVMLENDTQKGSWWRINKKYPKDEVRMDVFSLWLDHGKSPKDGTYAYIVSPAVKPGALNASNALKEYASSISVKVLCNSPGLQAVKHKKDGCLGAVFFQPGSLVTDRGFRLSVNKPCLVMMRRIENGYYLAVSNPRNEALAVDVEINRKLEGAGSTWDEELEVSRIGFEFPKGPSAGKSRVRRIKFMGEQGGI